MNFLIINNFIPKITEERNKISTVYKIVKNKIDNNAFVA